jgi:hypothetical protein
MEAVPSGIDGALLRKLKVLARPGAFLRRRNDGADLVCPGKTPGRTATGVSLEEVTRALAAGWITEAGADQMMLTKRGKSIVRVAGTAVAGRAAPSRDRNAAKRPRFNRDESPLAWLRRRTDKQGEPLLSAAEFEAGERLRTDFWFAQMTPRVTASWSTTAPVRRHRRGGPMAVSELSDNALAARQCVTQALAAVGPELAGVLIDVCCHLQGLEQAERSAGWPQRAGKVILQIALKRLARHYGIEAGPPPKTASRIRHWGADGYRPAIDGTDVQEEANG